MRHVPAAVLPLAYADTAERDHDVLGELLELPVTVFDPLTADEAPEVCRVLARYRQLDTSPGPTVFHARPGPSVIDATGGRRAVLEGGRRGLK